MISREIPKNIRNKIFYKTKRLKEFKNKLNGYLREKTEEGINQEFGINVYTPLYIKQITNEDLLYSTGNSIQYSIITYMGNNLKKRLYVYV